MSDSKNVSPVGWYVATYVLRFVVIGDEHNEDPQRMFRVWENTILVQATDLDDAYDKTVEIGMEAAEPYKGGPDAIDVQWRFEGVAELMPIYEKIEHGAEIMWADRRRKLANVRRSVRGRGEFTQ